MALEDYISDLDKYQGHPGNGIESDAQASIIELLKLAIIELRAIKAKLK